MKPIYIIGASGLAREVATYILDCKTYSIVAFVDKEKGASTKIIVRKRAYSVISEEDFFLKHEQKKRIKPCVVIAIGYPKIRKHVAEKYACFCNFPNIIHPKSFWQSMPKIGKGNILAPYTTLSVDTIIGNFNLINYGTTVGHDTVIGDFNVILPQNIISGNVVIGSQNLFGAGTSVIEKITVGDGNTIGMGSVCIKHIANNDTWLGVPAKKYFRLSDIHIDINTSSKIKE
jgi:sugar O-acyltransferase (sialic acid O-acetyltransferase NeuD family)